MFQCKCKLAALMVLGMLVGLGLTQAQPAKEVKAEKVPPVKKKPAEPDTFKDDLKIVQQAGLKGEGVDLLEYLRKRTLKQPDPKEISALVKQLGDEDFRAREKAFTSLVTLGASALAGIKEGENDPDLEVRKRVASICERHRGDLTAQRYQFWLHRVE